MKKGITGNNSLASQVYKHRFYYMLILIPLAYYFIFCYIPIGGLVIAFQDYNFFKGIGGSEWVGLKWFAQLIHSTDFWKVLRNTVLISSYRIIFTFPAPIIFALMLNDCKNLTFKRIIQTVSYLPHFISWSIVAGLIVTLLSPSVGIVNQIIEALGYKKIYFMAEPDYIRGITQV